MNASPITRSMQFVSAPRVSPHVNFYRIRGSVHVLTGTYHLSGMNLHDIIRIERLFNRAAFVRTSVTRYDFMVSACFRKEDIT